MAKSKLITEATARTLGSLLEDKKSLVVPIYQRAYVWETSEISDFVSDLIYVAKGNDKEHFFGSLVLADDPEQSTDSYVVIDGQQRLTTFMLTCKAFRDAIWLIKSLMPSHVEGLKVTVIDSQVKAKLYLEDFETPRLKHSKHDRAKFHEILSGCNENHAVADFEKFYAELSTADGRLVAAYKYLIIEVLEFLLDVNADSIGFKPVQLVSDEAQNRSSGIVDRIKALREALIEKSYVVDITVSSPGAGFAIFESLNATGKPLSTSDLVKNHLLMRASRDVRGNSSEEELFTIIEDEWDRIIDCVKESRFPRFLRHFLNTRSGANVTVSMNHTFDAFRDYVEEQGVSEVRNELIKSAVSYSNIYAPSKLDSAKQKNLRKYVEDLNKLDARRCDPLLLVAFELDLHKSQDPRRLKQFETLLWHIQVLYLRRSLILGRDNKSLEQDFIDWARELVEGKGTNLNHICKQIAAKVPADNEVLGPLEVRKNMKASHVKWLFAEIENHTHKKQNSPLRVGDATLEHVMPQTRGEKWRAIPNYDEWVSRLGNLTILSGSTNSGFGNSEWKKKKAGLAKDELKLNDVFSTYSNWNEKSIETRQKSLASQILKIWTV